MTNKYKPHVLVVPEDDANRQILNGFLIGPNLDPRAIQILPPRGGWRKVLEDFKKNHIPMMYKYPYRMMILVIDFDRNSERLDIAKAWIPSDLCERVFILGVFSEPEQIKKETGLSFEAIGKGLAKDCADNTEKLWGHNLLAHNKSELDRLVVSVKPLLFATITL